MNRDTKVWIVWTTFMLPTAIAVAFLVKGFLVCAILGFMFGIGYKYLADRIVKTSK